MSKVMRTEFDPGGSPGVRGNTRTTGGPLPYLSGEAPRRAGKPGYRVRAGAKGRDLCWEQELLFCSTRAFKRNACFQRGEEAARETDHTQGKSSCNNLHKSCTAQQMCSSF